MKKILGIIGGMGPLATAHMFKKIIKNTEAKCDQDHIRIFIDNNTSIPDRTEYLLGRGIDPREKLLESANKLKNMGADYIVMPCNTAHVFYDYIVENANIKLINMIEVTIKYILNNFSPISTLGLLATQGTCNVGVYDKIAEEYGLGIIKPSNKNQQFITQLIYNIKSGICDLKLDGFYQTVEELMNAGAELLILGCTELSVLNEMFNITGNFMDPMEIVSYEIIKSCQ